MKNMKYKIDEKDEEQKIYDDLFEHVMHMLNEHQLPVDVIASTLMAIGQRLYRTHLSEKSYHLMMDMIRDYPVEPYEVKKERIH
tara:strand:+ start:1063 stop:1314 length:252 start_codon:yes stop_codon:yes gene_type:complete